MQNKFWRDLVRFLACALGARACGATLASATVLSSPSLSIQASSSQVLIISWPSAFANFVLEQGSTPGTARWVSSTNPVGAVSGNNQVTINARVGAMFFRLMLTNGGAGATPPGMALIPSGTFTMGDSLDGESDALPVSASLSAVYMDTNLVSYAVWTNVYAYAANHGAGKGPHQPAQSVDWFDCVKWCNALSQQAGLPPVYYTDANLTQVYTNGESSAVYPNWSAGGDRLPTKAEWEYASRGGLAGQRFPWGMAISERWANYMRDPEAYSYDLGPNGYNASFATADMPCTCPVGSFAPNSYGLFDMAGNVSQ